MILDLIQKELKKLNRQIDKLDKKRHALILEKSNYIEQCNAANKKEETVTENIVENNVAPVIENKVEKPVDESPKEPVQHLIFCLRRSTGDSLKSPNIIFYHLNGNANVTKDIDAILKSKYSIAVLNDGKNEEERNVMIDFAKTYGLKIIGE